MAETRETILAVSLLGNINGITLSKECIETTTQCQCTFILETGNLVIRKCSEYATSSPPLTRFFEAPSRVSGEPEKDCHALVKVRHKDGTEEDENTWSPLGRFDFNVYDITMSENSSLSIKTSDMFEENLHIHLGENAQLEIGCDANNISANLKLGSTMKLFGMFRCVDIFSDSEATVVCHSVSETLNLVTESALLNGEISTMPWCTVEKSRFCTGVSVFPIEGLELTHGDATAQQTSQGDSSSSSSSSLPSSFSRRPFTRTPTHIPYRTTNNRSLFGGAFDSISSEDFANTMFSAFSRRAGALGISGVHFSGIAVDPESVFTDGDDLVGANIMDATTPALPPPRRRKGNMVGNVSLPNKEVEEGYANPDEYNEASKVQERPTKRRRKTPTRASADKKPKPKLKPLPAGDKFCILCELRTAKVAFQPCSHCDVCIECAYKTMEHDPEGRCPRCRTQVVEGLRIYK